jgi:type IV secretion system protein VirB9
VPYAAAWGGAALATAGREEPTAAGLPAAQPAEDRTEGAMRILRYAPGRIYAVKAAPLRVTTLNLEAGETLIDKAAGDTVRWQIGETTSGSGAQARTLVLIKPLTAGLATNMVLTTSRRVYLLDLASSARGFDPAVAWSYPQEPTTPSGLPPSEPAFRIAGTRYQVEPKGRPPSWTPRAVFDDGRRTYIAFPPGLDREPAPVLLVEDAEGRPGLANYRLIGDLIVVDRLFHRAELRLGRRRPAVVRIIRLEHRP